MKNANLKLALLLMILLTLWLVTPAEANAGVPMIFLTFPGMMKLLIPVILIESYFSKDRIKESFFESCWIFGIANFISTVIGIPITWFILVAIEMIVTDGGRAYGLSTLWHKILAVTVQAPWLIPYEKDLHWMIPVAIIVLLIPYFLVSWWSEYIIVKKILTFKDPILLKSTIFRANIISYMFLLVVVIAMGLSGYWGQ
jgi:hypothetical protein